MMYKIVQDLTNLNRVFCSTDYDKSIKLLSKILNFKIYKFSNKKSFNGWIIPPKWDLIDAKIYKNKKIIYDGMKNPLSVIALSKPVNKYLNLKNLKKHLHFDSRSSTATPYHFRQMYQSWNREWGFCVPKKFYDSLTEGNFRAIIKTKESKGYLKVLEYNLKGKSKKTIVFVAHLDHPGMSNDNLSGCAVGIQLFKYLSKKKLKFSYSLLLTQEIIGSEYYLNTLSKKNKSNILESLCLDTLGSRTKISLQSSFKANSNIEYFLEKSLIINKVKFNKKKYKEVIGNDENTWESYGIPMATFTRFPYPEYHTDKDNINIISNKSLNEAIKILKSTINLMEKDKYIIKKFKGNVCLSNPKYKLYIDPGQPAFENVNKIENVNLRKIMDIMPLLNDFSSLSTIANLLKIDYAVLYKYLNRWKEKKLLKIF